jgi:hypothetical protein
MLLPTSGAKSKSNKKPARSRRQTEYLFGLFFDPEDTNRKFHRTSVDFYRLNGFTTQKIILSVCPYQFCLIPWREYGSIMIQTERWRVPFPIRSLDFSIDLILPAEPYSPGVDSAWQKLVPATSTPSVGRLSSKTWELRRLTNLHDLLQDSFTF